MLREQWKKSVIQADLADALWRGEAVTLQVSLPLEHPHRLRGIFCRTAPSHDSWGLVGREGTGCAGYAI